jgi:hypothetical protein
LSLCRSRSNPAHEILAFRQQPSLHSDQIECRCRFGKPVPQKKD